MRIPDILGSVEGCQLFTARMTHKRQKADTEDAKAVFDWTVDFVIDLQDEEVLESVPNYLSGGIEAVAVAKEGRGSSVIRHKPLSDWRYVRITIRSNGADLMVDAGAEVRNLQIVATEKSTRYRAKVLIAGLSAELSGFLLECDHRTVTCDFEPVQQRTDDK